MGNFAERIAYALIRLAQHTPLGGKGDSCCPKKCRPVVDSDNVAAAFPQAAAEADRFQDFVQYLGSRLDVNGLRVLDLGCGYGGKTIEFARQSGAREVVGVEPYANMVDLCRAYGARVGEPRCTFRVCGMTTIPASDGEFDAVVSHDVLEHVEHPPSTLSEISRVLRPGGLAYIIFTPYWGALSHHLGYVTRIPGIHWMFSARSLVDAVNRVLSRPGGDRFNTRPQPSPRMAYHDRFECLPTLNGLGSHDFIELTKRNSLEVMFLEHPPIASHFLPGRAWAWAVCLNRGLMSMHPLSREMFSFNLVCVLRKVA